MILWHLLPGAAPSFLAFLTPLGGVADLLRYGGLLCSGRPAGLLRTPGRFTPEHAVLVVNDYFIPSLVPSKAVCSKYLGWLVFPSEIHQH